MVDTNTNSTLIEQEVYSNEIKEIFEDMTMMDPLVKWVTDFGTGETLHIPTVGQMTVRDYTEGNEIEIDDASSGEFTLTIDKYKQAAFAITDKFKEDSVYVNQAVSAFVKELTRATARQKESDIANVQASQTAGDLNTIDGEAHRFVGGGTGNALELKDFHRAALALTRSSVDKVGRKAVLDPSVTYALSINSNVLDSQIYGPNNHLQENISGSAQLGRFAGFDVVESNYLDEGLSETIDGTAVTNGVANMFLGEEAIIGAMRTMPELEDYREPNKKRHVYTGSVRYGLKLFRPESLVVGISDKTTKN